MDRVGRFIRGPGQRSRGIVTRRLHLRRTMEGRSTCLRAQRKGSKLARVRLVPTDRRSGSPDVEVGVGELAGGGLKAVAAHAPGRDGEVGATGDLVIVDAESARAVEVAAVAAGE